MTIEDPVRYVEGIWDWGILKGCFGDTRIEPTDVDGLVERNGHFLLLEAKAPGVPVKQGQWWTFNALRNTGYFTIIVVWGQTNAPEAMQVLYPPPLAAGPKKQADLNDLRNVVSWWFARVNRKRRVS